MYLSVAEMKIEFPIWASPCSIEAACARFYFTISSLFNPLCFAISQKSHKPTKMFKDFLKEVLRDFQAVSFIKYQDGSDTYMRWSRKFGAWIPSRRKRAKEDSVIRSEPVEQGMEPPVTQSKRSSQSRQSRDRHRNRRAHSYCQCQNQRQNLRSVSDKSSRRKSQPQAHYGRSYVVYEPPLIDFITEHVESERLRARTERSRSTPYYTRLYNEFPLIDEIPDQSAYGYRRSTSRVGSTSNSYSAAIMSWREYEGRYQDRR